MVEHQNVSYMTDEYLGQFLKSSENPDNFWEENEKSPFDEIKKYDLDKNMKEFISIYTNL